MFPLVYQNFIEMHKAITKLYRDGYMSTGWEIDTQRIKVGSSRMLTWEMAEGWIITCCKPDDSSMPYLVWTKDGWTPLKPAWAGETTYKANPRPGGDPIPVTVQRRYLSNYSWV